MKTPIRFAFALLTAAAAFAGSKDKTLDVYWIDSEGGGSTLIVTPNDESVLIDTGNPGARDSGRIIAAAKAAGLTKLDYVLLTHYHIDHFGGGAEVAQALPFGALFERGVPEGDPDGGARGSFFQTQIKPWREIATKREKLTPGVIIPLRAVNGGPKLELRCIAADKKAIEPTDAQKKTRNALTSEAKTIPPSDNDNSAVFVLSFGGFKFFDGGDLTHNYEANLVSPYNLVGAVDVYQTNHHGLEVSNNPILVQSLEPTVVLMNNGPTKGGQAGTFAAIRSAKSVQALYQIHKSFNVAEDVNAPAEFIANKENLRGPAAAQCPAEVIKMTIAADGKSYTITVPSTGHSKTYRTKG
jgi:beta-lactamase superfamily II metal-dependent hydrolase